MSSPRSQVEPYLKISDNLFETLSFIVLALVTAVLATAPTPRPDEQNIAFNIVVYVTAAVLLARTIYVAAKKVCGVHTCLSSLRSAAAHASLD